MSNKSAKKRAGTESPRKRRPEELVIRRLDVLFARAEGYSDRSLERAKYRYVKTPDVRDDELGYGDQLEVRFLTVGKDCITEHCETVIRARSGRLLAPSVESRVAQAVADEGSGAFDKHGARLPDEEVPPEE
jgi:hypothetical protein